MVTDIENINKKGSYIHYFFIKMPLPNFTPDKQTQSNLNKQFSRKKRQVVCFLNEEVKTKDRAGV